MIGHVSICIVGFRNPEEIAGCLEALARSTYPRFEVVVCENGGTDAYRALQAAVPAKLAGGQSVSLIEAEGNLGYAGGVNRCIRARPDADAWWIVNPDTVPAPGALQALAERLVRGDCAAVGSLLHHGDRVQAYGGRWRPWLARAESIGNGASLGSQVDAGAVERRMNYVLGASMLVGRELTARVGLMREDYFLYCEEVEWALRAVAAGLRLGFAPASRVEHGQGGTTGSGGEIRTRPRLPIYLDERNKIHVVRDTAPARLPVAIVAAFVLLALRYLPRRAWRQWRYGLAGWWAGVRGERGMPAWL